MTASVHPRKSQTESPENSYSYEEWESGFEDEMDFEEASQNRRGDSFQDKANGRDKIHSLERRSSRFDPEQDQDKLDLLDEWANSDDESSDVETEDNDTKPTQKIKDEKMYVEIGNKIEASVGKVGYVTYTTDESHSSLATAGGAAGGAAAGAVVGSVVPVLGTAAGAVVGGVIGGILGRSHSESVEAYPIAATPYTVGYFQNLDKDDRKLHTEDLQNQAKNEAAAAQEILGLVSQAVKESDPVKQKDLWEQASTKITLFRSQDGVDGGSANNMAQLVFNVLYGELGEGGLKEALQNGIIDSSFADKLAGTDGLLARSDENDGKTSESEIASYQRGGAAERGMTHKGCAELMTQWSSKSLNIGEE